MAETASEKPTTSSKSKEKKLLLTDTENIKNRAVVIGQFRDFLKNSSKQYPFLTKIIIAPEINDRNSFRITTPNNTSLKISLNKDATLPTLLETMRNDGLNNEYGIMIPGYLSDLMSLCGVILRLDNAIYANKGESSIPYYSNIDGTFRKKDGTIIIDFKQEGVSRRDIENIINGFSYILKIHPSISPDWEKDT